MQGAIGRLQQWYNPTTRLWQSTGWWNSANTLTVLVDFSRATHSAGYDAVIHQTYTANRSKGFLNQFYDDEGWKGRSGCDAAAAG